MRIFILSLLFMCQASCQQSALGPFQACGLKVGEVSDSSAIVWTRLTKKRSANPEHAPWFHVEYEGLGLIPATEEKNIRKPVLGIKIDEPATSPNGIRWAAPGAKGATRVGYRVDGSRKWLYTEWQKVDPEADFTRQHVLNQLKPGSKYEVTVEGRDETGGGGSVTKGSFRTAPEETDAEAPVEFTVSTGQAFRDRDDDKGFNIYDAMLKTHPELDFFVHTGDIVYLRPSRQNPGAGPLSLAADLFTADECQIPQPGCQLLYQRRSRCVDQ